MATVAADVSREDRDSPITRIKERIQFLFPVIFNWSNSIRVSWQHTVISHPPTDNPAQWWGLGALKSNGTYQKQEHKDRQACQQAGLLSVHAREFRFLLLYL